MSKFFKTHKTLKISAILATYSLSTYISYHLYKLYILPSPSDNCSDPNHQSCVSNNYINISKTYDSDISTDEYLMNIHKRRKSLLLHCSGDVLEVSAGTGRNLNYYPQNISSLVVSDIHLSMLQNALDKPRSFNNTKFHVMDAHNLPIKTHAFDTVVDTFGLCSMDDPVAALKEMKRVCKINGHILLLEHGSSHYPWLNNILNKTASLHANKWGCWWNRDILNLINDAGLHVEDIKRYDFGTTYWIKIKNTD